MSVGPSAEDGDLRRQLEAERAASAHWRRVATQRSIDYAALRHRTFVRAVLAVERRLAPAREPVETLIGRGRALGGRTLLAAGGLGGRAGGLLVDLRSTLRSLPAPPLAPLPATRPCRVRCAMTPWP